MATVRLLWNASVSSIIDNLLKYVAELGTCNWEQNALLHVGYVNDVCGHNIELFPINRSEMLKSAIAGSEKSYF